MDLVLNRLLREVKQGRDLFIGHSTTKRLNQLLLAACEPVFAACRKKSRPRALAGNMIEKGPAQCWWANSFFSEDTADCICHMVCGCVLE
jgi:hypothetical protein